MKKIRKKTKKIIILCVCLTLVAGILLGGGITFASYFGIGAFNQHDHTEYAENRDLLSFRAPFEADAIWIKESGVAVWAAFTKDIILSQDEDVAIFDVACDTHYWLWVNGKEIVWEGSLKRGVTPNDGFYDRVEIRNAFHAGKNNVSVLVRHLGDDGFSHKDSGQGGLVIEGTIGDTPFATDGTWKAKKFAYRYSALDFLNNLNFRLSERGSKVKGEDYSAFWLGEGAENWSPAVILDQKTSAQLFGKSYLNPLPSKTVGDPVFFDLSGHESVTVKKTTLTFSLPCNEQFCPYFEFSADKSGRKVTYYTENKKLDYKNVYSSKKGENLFLDFAWLNGETLTVTLDKGITLKRVGYRPTGYGTTRDGSFSCSDDDLTRLWQKAANTLIVTMRDSYMDCPDRERAQWIGDAVIESDMSFYSLSPESAALFRKAIVTTYGWVHKDGVIQTVVPNGVKAYELPQQNLAFLVGCVQYVEYSGDSSVIPMILSMAEGYLPLWEMKNGLVCHRTGSWDWCDWGKNADVPVLENAWYYYAMSRLLTVTPPESAFARFCNERMQSIQSAFGAYYRSNGISSERTPDDRANAIAVLAGLYLEEDRDAITSTLFSVRNSSPYMEKYVEQALCKLGRTDLALLRAKEAYADMIKDDCSTLWELWDKNAGTTNHAWAGGTLYILSRYVGGVYPTENGFSSFVVQPDVSVLTDFALSLHPVDGVEISLQAERLDNGRQKLTVVCSSSGGKLVVTGKNCVFNGVGIDSAQSERRKFVLTAGVNELIYE